jgi:hypothetical protein
LPVKRFELGVGEQHAGLGLGASQEHVGQHALAQRPAHRVAAVVLEPALGVHERGEGSEQILQRLVVVRGLGQILVPGPDLIRGGGPGHAQHVVEGGGF